MAFTIHVELAAQSRRGLERKVQLYREADVLNLPRRPNLVKNMHPRDAIRALHEIDKSLAAKACPHLVAYDYKSRDELLRGLEFYRGFGATQALMVRGETVFEGLAHYFLPAVEFRRNATLRMLDWCREHCQKMGINIAVAGEMPREEKKTELIERIKVEMDRAHGKINKGAQVVLTQPLHDYEMFDEYCRWLEASKMHLAASFRQGVALWANPHLAAKICRRIRGINMPIFDHSRLLRFPENEEASSRVGEEIAKEKIQEILNKGVFDGIIIFPFGDEAANRVPSVVEWARNAAKFAEKATTMPHLRLVRSQ